MSSRSKQNNVLLWCFLDITIDDSRTVQWDSTYGVHLDEEASVSSVDKSTVLIALAYDVQMRIRRTQTSDGSYYLGLFITHNGGIGDDATGIMGKNEEI